MACQGNSGEHRLSPGAVVLVIDNVGPPSGTSVAEWLAKADQESDYRDKCLHTGGSAVGLWGVLASHAGRIPGSPATEAQMQTWLQNPVNNMKAAKYLYEQARGWGPWAASGGRPTVTAAHRAAVNDPTGPGGLGSGVGAGDILNLFGDAARNPGEAVDAAGEILSGLNPLDDIAEAIENAVSAVVDTINKVGGWLSKRENWIRVGQVVGGVGMGFIAVNLMAKPVVEDKMKEVIGAVGGTKAKAVAGKVAKVGSSS
jgi:hypothetical protein